MNGRMATLSTLLLISGVLVACTGGGTSRPTAAKAPSGADPRRVSAQSVAGSVTSGVSGGRATAGVRTGATTAASHLAPQLILTGSLSVVVRSVDRAAARAESIAAGAGGRTDSDDQDSARGSRPMAELTLRVPNSAAPSVLDRLAGLGHQTERHLSTRDVTTEVADVTSRVASARSSITSLRALYARAAKVGDVIRIESSLSQREASLESLEARQRSLNRQVALATITVDLTQRKAAPAPAVRSTTRGGFVGGLERGWHAFTTGAAGLAVALGAALPFLVALALLAAAALVVRRRLRPRPAARVEAE